MQGESVEIRDLRQQDWLWTSKALLFHKDVDASMYKAYAGLSTYANNLTQKAFPSMVTLARKIHMGKRTILRSLAKLEEMHLITVERQLGKHNVYTLLDVIVEPEVPKEKPKKTTALVEKKDEGKEITVNVLIEEFKNVNPSYMMLFKNSNQRKAMERLMKQWDGEKLKATIKLLNKSNTMPFAPVITTPIQLEEKIGSLVAFWQKKKVEIQSKKIVTL